MDLSPFFFLGTIMKIRLWFLFTSTLLGSLGCGTSEDAVKSSGSQRTDIVSATSKRTIGVSLLTLDNPFFKVIGDSITAEGKKLGYETIVVSGDKDVAKQSNQIKDFIVKKVSAIVLSPCDSKSIIPVIQEANAAGIPVFTVDIPCNEPGVKIATQVATLDIPFPTWPHTLSVTL